MTWDHIYPGFSVDQEDYSILYTEKREAAEVEWASHNLKAEDNTEFILSDAIQHEGSLSSESVSGPMKKQKYILILLSI